MDMQPPPSHEADIRRKAADKAIALLAASGAKFHVKFADGSEVKSANYDEPTAGKRTHKRTHKRGELSSIYLPVVRDMQPGDAGVIDIPEHIRVRFIQSAVAGWCTKNWGPGSYITETNTDRTKLTVLRVE